MKRFAIFVTGFFFLATVSAMAGPLTGTKEISLRDADGGQTVIGHVHFSQDGDHAAYEIQFLEEAFTDHFLSMRPFKCLEGSDKHWCHVPYPYPILRRVSADDLTDLEYDFLFIWKGATEYGINTWNGVYYLLKVDEDRLIGRLHEMDMSILSAPPDAGDMRPIQAPDLHEGDPDSHWLSELVIE